MDFSYSTQETSAASAAIKALQSELRDLRSENSRLKSDLHNSSLSTVSLKESFEKQLDSSKIEFFQKESAMKEDLIFLCQKVKNLEQENLEVIQENQRLKEIVLEGKQNQRMIVLLQEEINMLNKKLQQKENEQDLLYKRISQLESNKRESPKEQTGFVSDLKSVSRFSNESPLEDNADKLDSVLNKQKMQYREYLKNPNPSSIEWKQKVDDLRKSIECNSQELLRLRKEQYEQLKQL